MKLRDWQVQVDASGNASTYLTMDKTPNVDLRTFFESLGLNYEGLVTALDPLYLNNTTYPDMPGMYANLQPDYADLINNITLTVDGNVATVDPVAQTGRTRDLTLALNAATSVNLIYSRTAEVGADLTDGVLTLTLRSSLRTVLHTAGAFEVDQDLRADGVGMTAKHATSSPAIYGDYLSYDPMTYKIDIEAAGAGKTYSVTARARLRWKDGGATSPAATARYQYALIIQGGGLDAKSVQAVNFNEALDGSLYFNCALDNIILSPGVKIWSEIRQMGAAASGSVEMVLWANAISVYVDEES